MDSKSPGAAVTSSCKPPLWVLGTKPRCLKSSWSSYSLNYSPNPLNLLFCFFKWIASDFPGQCSLFVELDNPYSRFSVTAAQAAHIRCPTWSHLSLPNLLPFYLTCWRISCDLIVPIISFRHFKLISSLIYL